MAMSPQRNTQSPVLHKTSLRGGRASILVMIQASSTKAQRVYSLPLIQEPAADQRRSYSLPARRATNNPFHPVQHTTRNTSRNTSPRLATRHSTNNRHSTNKRRRQPRTTPRRLSVHNQPLSHTTLTRLHGMLGQQVRRTLHRPRTTLPKRTIRRRTQSRTAVSPIGRPQSPDTAITATATAPPPLHSHPLLTARLPGPATAHHSRRRRQQCRANQLTNQHCKVLNTHRRLFLPSMTNLILHRRTVASNIMHLRPPTVPAPIRARHTPLRPPRHHTLPSRRCP